MSVQDLDRPPQSQFTGRAFVSRTGRTGPTTLVLKRTNKGAGEVGERRRGLLGEQESPRLPQREWRPTSRGQASSVAALKPSSHVD